MRPRRSSASSTRSAQPKVLVLNKVDLADKPRLLDAGAGARTRAAKFDATFMISALTGDGVADLRDGSPRMCRTGPWHYPEDEVSDAPMRQLAAEITREKLFLQAAPGIAVPVDGRDRDLDGAQGRLGAHRADDLCGARKPAQDRARQGRATHQGDRRGGAQELAEILEKPVHLFLFVKVREGWGDDPERYRADGAGVSEGVTARDGGEAACVLQCSLLACRRMPWRLAQPQSRLQPQAPTSRHRRDATRAGALDDRRSAGGVRLRAGATCRSACTVYPTENYYYFRFNHKGVPLCRQHPACRRATATRARCISPYSEEPTRLERRAGRAGTWCLMRARA